MKVATLFPNHTHKAVSALERSVCNEWAQRGRFAFKNITRSTNYAVALMLKRFLELTEIKMVRP